ncbi:uncharacterized protein [Aegilops tauschii subsp. strangulata]|uniref:uncharacterized protein n=1 Tax=Aegilops tauschii subsp. strangulata TaxID=200361 RepID=UPI00098A7099|nr:uncharacterized protein LOC109761495 [Aegilops tauschii subsp. strangulata]
MRVSTEIFNLVHYDGASAADLWAALHQLFQDNVDARANNLHTELQNTVQGDSPVSVYCQRLKAIADELRELGDPIDDHQLINVLLIGLSERFDKQTSFIPMMRPRLSFAEAAVVPHGARSCSAPGSTNCTIAAPGFINRTTTAARMAPIS